MKVINIDDIQVSNWNELQKIKWKFIAKNYAKEVDNIITFDTENSSAVVKNNKAYGFKYDFAETQSGRDFYKECAKTVITYVWSCAIETGIEEEPIKVFIGRTWQDFRIFLSMLTTEIGLKSIDNNFPGSEWSYRKSMFKEFKACSYYVRPTFNIYIHNLPYEFQFMRNIFEKQFSIENSLNKNRPAVFAREQRKPMRVEIGFNKTRILFKDTLVLTQKSLANWCKDSKLPVSKLAVPEHYYEKIRTPNTKLTEFDIKYSVGDVVSMVYGLEQYRNKYGKLSKIPMTQTGEVRNICRERLKNNIEWCKKCSEIMGNLSLRDFRILCEVFAGGWTHANMMYTGANVKNVRCFDFASSYPFSMTAFKYPVESFKEVSLNEVEVLESIDPRSLDIENKYLVKIECKNISSRIANTFWSSSKCLELENPVIDNGKILTADFLSCYMTDLDYHIFTSVYSGEIEVVEIYKAKADFLPKELVLTILEYFGYKTSLKGLEDSESLYLESKQFINSIYGVAVTKVINDEVIFTENNKEGVSGWDKNILTEEKYDELASKNFDKDGNPKTNLFLHFAIGCFVTAYSRSNLWYILKQCDNHVVYGDTDSLKGPFDECDIEVIDAYNKWVVEREREVAAELGFSEKLYHPETSKGVEKRLGIFEEEDACLEFKTLGAKRYVNMIQIPKEKYDEKKHKLVRFEDDKALILEATIAGLPKKSATKKLKNVDDFVPGIHWNTFESGKKMAYYIDNGPTNVEFTDLNGDKYVGGEKYGVTILPTTFDMNLSQEYEWLLDALENYGEDTLENVSFLLKTGL